MSASAVELRAEGVSVRLGGHDVLRGIDAGIRPGWTAIVGPNGAGKSTLLRAFAGLIAPSAGRVLLDGVDLRTVGPAPRARRVAWLAQQGEVTGELTVEETVGLGRLPHLGLLAVPGAADRLATERAMALCGCAAWRTRRLDALSGGERQRVLLARVLCTEAPLLLLDEPTTHLDAPHQVAMARLFRRLVRDEGRTVVTVLHDLPVALQADRLLVLDAGALRAHGSPRDPTVHAAVAGVFGGAVRIELDAAGRPRVALTLDDGEAP